MRLFFSSMKGIGVDIFCLDRIDLNHTHTIEKILTETEYSVFKSFQSDKAKREFFGGRFAAKEAYIKASHQAIAYSNIEILNNEDGQPYFTNDSKALVSISHETCYAIAFVVIP